MSSLDALRSKQTEDYRVALDECPPVSKALLEYLGKMFSRKVISPTAPMMQQELVYQAGIDKVIDFLRNRNDKQERDIRRQRTK